jgi:hypothetical protein
MWFMFFRVLMYKKGGVDWSVGLLCGSSAPLGSCNKRSKVV